MSLEDELRQTKDAVSSHVYEIAQLRATLVDCVNELRLLNERITSLKISVIQPRGSDAGG